MAQKGEEKLPAAFCMLFSWITGLMNLNDFYKQTDYFRMIFIFTSASFSIKYIELLSILFTYIYGVILYFSKVYSLIPPEYDTVFWTTLEMINEIRRNIFTWIRRLM